MAIRMLIAALGLALAVAACEKDTGKDNANKANKEGAVKAAPKANTAPLADPAAAEAAAKEAGNDQVTQPTAVLTAPSPTAKPAEAPKAAEAKAADAPTAEAKPAAHAHEAAAGGCGGHHEDKAAGGAKKAGGCGGCGGASASASSGGGGCGENLGGTNKLENPKLEERQEGGKTIVHAGNVFAGVETVKVSELVAKPDAYAGKTIRLEGDITAMCHHKRAWFAMAAEDRSGRNVRVVTVPTFLVPPKSIGKRAVIEGKVEVVEVPEARAKHLAEEHKLREPGAITGPLKEPLVRATGADFF